MDRVEFKSAISGWIVSRMGTDGRAEGAILRFSDVFDRLHEGIVHFWFRKSDGTLRSAYGTLVLEIISRHTTLSEPDEKDRRDPHQSGLVTYFDLEKDAWRCFKADSVQEIDTEY